MTLRISSRFTFLFLTVLLFHVPSVGAVKIVRLQLEYGSDTIIASGGYDIPKTNKILDLELYDDLTPITVSNYLDYVISNAYDLTFINRSIPGFVLQAGGITNTSAPDEPIGPNTFDEVFATSTIINEPGSSNARGTIAMAKVAAQFVEGGSCVEEGPDCTLVDGTGADSATSEWFVNLKDNSNPLDTTNGGFTVFGSVIDDGMEAADQISLLPIANAGIFFGPAFTDLPLADADPDPDLNAGPVADFTQSNLVMILSVTEISRPILRFSSKEGYFIYDASGGVAGLTLNTTLTNTGNEDLIVAPIFNDDITLLYSIQSENCSNTSLIPVSIIPVPTSSCSLSLNLLPTETGVFDESLTINYSSQLSGELFSVKFNPGYKNDDSDGIPSVIENSSPNDGDNNNDSTIDSLQSNVASFNSKADEYISLVVDDNNTLSNIRTTSDDQLIDLPGNVVFKHGVHDYDITVESPGAIIEVGLVLPSGAAPAAYYLFGETDDNMTPHWYPYGAAQVFPNSKIITPSGEEFIHNYIKLVVQDGGPGDADKTVNGKVSIVSSAVAYPHEDSSGSVSVIFLNMLAIILLFYRRNIQLKKWAFLSRDKIIDCN